MSECYDLMEAMSLSPNISMVRMFRLTTNHTHGFVVCRLELRIYDVISYDVIIVKHVESCRDSCDLNPLVRDVMCSQMLKKYVEEGGSLLVMLGEGGEKLNKTNINYLLEEYGMSINSGTSRPAVAAAGVSSRFYTR